MNLNMKVGIRMGKIILLSQHNIFYILLAGNLGLFWLFLFFFISWPSEIIFSIFIARNVLAAASKKTITKILKRGVIAVYYEK